MFRYNQNSWTNLLNKSPAMSAITGPGGGVIRQGGLGIQRRRNKTYAASGSVSGQSRGRGVGSVTLRAERFRLFELGLLLMHLDCEKPKLRFQAGSRAWPSKISARFLTFAPKQGARGERRVGPRPAQEGAQADLARKPSCPGLSWVATHQVPYPSESRASAPLPPDLATGEGADFRKPFQKNKSPTSTLLD